MTLRASFVLPYRFINEGLYRVPVSREGMTLEVKVRIKMIQNFSGFRDTTGMGIATSLGGHVEMNPDTKGVANLTKVTIEFPHNKNLTLKGISSLQMPENNLLEGMLKRDSIHILNTLRHIIRSSTNNFWIPAVNTMDIKSLEILEVETNQFYFSMGSPTELFPIDIFQEDEKITEVNRILNEDIGIPVWKNILLDAINYFSVEGYNESVITINAALESFVADHLYKKLLSGEMDQAEARKQTLKMYKEGKFTKVMKNHFPKVDGRLLDNNKFLSDRFEKIRKIRSHAVHSFTRRIKRDEALTVLYDSIILMEWIDPASKILKNFYKEYYMIETAQVNIKEVEPEYIIDPSWHLLYLNAFGYPEGLVMDSQGFLFVVDHNNSVKKVDEKGRIVEIWEKSGEGEGKLKGAYSLVIDTNDQLYITDYDKIQKFDSKSNFLGSLYTNGKNVELSSPHGMAIDKNNTFYVSNEGSNCIAIFDSNGNVVMKFGGYGFGKGEFNHPMGIATSSTGEIYVIDQLNHRTQVFDSNGKFLFQWGGFGQRDGEFNRPHGIFIDHNDRIFITDFFNDRVQLFDKNGQFLSKFESIRRPREIYVDNAGVLYISEHYLKTVIRLIPKTLLSSMAVQMDRENTYEKLEMSSDSTQHYWRGLVNVTKLYGDTGVLNLWEKINSELLGERPTPYTNYALDLLLLLTSKERDFEKIKELYLHKLVVILSDTDWTWYEQKTRAKLLIEGILSQEDKLKVLFNITKNIMESMNTERFYNCIPYVLYDIGQYSEDKKNKFVSDLKNQFHDKSYDTILQMIKAIEDFLINNVL